MKRILFIDRDGVLIKEPPDQQIDSFDKLEFYPGVFSWLSKIAAETDCELARTFLPGSLPSPVHPDS